MKIMSTKAAMETLTGNFSDCDQSYIHTYTCNSDIVCDNDDILLLYQCY